MSSKSLKIFVTGDSPRSLKKITLFNWSGYAYLGSKTHIKDIEKRSDINGTGIYFLLSETDYNTVSLYVGETDNFLERIKSHVRDKDWWDSFIVFQSKDNLLNKAHVRYLEKHFWEKAKNSPQIELKNTQSPSGTNLAEEDLSDLKFFEENILFILEALNLSYFTQDYNSNSKNELYPQYRTDVEEFEATMTLKDETYILNKGSTIQLIPRDSFERNNSGYFRKWKEITEDSKLVTKKSENLGTLKQDLEFSSPSLCAVIAKGRATNGLTAWRNLKSGKTLKQELEE